MTCDTRTPKIIPVPQVEDVDLPENFVLSIVGPRRSGKTTFSLALIKKMMSEKRFSEDNVILLSPTAHLSQSYKAFKKIQSFKDPSEYKQIIFELLEMQADLLDSMGNDKAPQVLLILDDCINETVITRGALAEKISTIGRHSNLSLIIACQALKGLSKKTRLNSDVVMLYAPFNVAEIEDYLTEFCFSSDKKLLKTKVQEFFNGEKYKFLAIDNQETSLLSKVKVNGTKERLLPLDMESVTVPVAGSKRTRESDDEQDVLPKSKKRKPVVGSKRTRESDEQNMLPKSKKRK